VLTYPEQWININESFIKEDIADYKAHIHKIKATFSFVGLSKLTALCETIEKNCSEHYDLNTLSSLHTDFKNNLAESIHIVEEELIRLQT
jgi:HPt (histidine-containing phosphotransfer) domain-containing protein